MSAAPVPETRPRTASSEFVRRFTNYLVELRLPIGINTRIEKMMGVFAEEHPNLRASYISRSVDETYFSDGAYGWEAAARPKLQGIAIEGDNMFEFLAFANGFRSHVTPLETIINVEEVWLEPALDQPFVMRVCLYHSFPATTILYAPDGDSQDLAQTFVHKLKYLRGY